MRIGMILPHWSGSMAGQTPTARQVVELGRYAEEIGIDSLWLTDHLYHETYLDFAAHGYELPEEYRGLRSGFWECWTLLSALAAVTTRVELGTMVSNMGLRNPALLANMSETVDALSDGRLVLGLGAGDFYSEHQFHGIPWDRRVSRFEESLKVLIPMLRGEQVTLDGTFCKAETAELLPRGPRPDGPEILIGSMQGGPRMMRLTAEYAHGWSCWIAFEDSHVDHFRAKFERSRESLDRHGVDPDSMRTVVAIGVCHPDGAFMVPGANPITGSADDVAGEIARYATAGVDDLCVLLQPSIPAGLDWFGEVLERARRHA